MAKILIIDDKPDLCTHLKTALREAGHEAYALQVVEDGIDALERSQSLGKPYEVAIIDLRFDNYSGGKVPKERAGMLVLEAAKQVRFLEPIMMTAFGSTRTASEALVQGVFRYLTKDFEESNPQCPKDFITRVVETVELAVGNREVFKMLDESISCLREEVKDLSKLCVGDTRCNGAISRASNYLADAEACYGIILKARGRNPG